MDLATLELLVKWQTAGIVAIGIAALTLIGNIVFARWQVWDGRRHERETVKRAIASELRFHEMILEGYIAAFRNQHPVMMMPPVTPTMDAYITKLGLLSADQVGYVTGAYFVLKELNAKLVAIYTQDLGPRDDRERTTRTALERALPTVKLALVSSIVKRNTVGGCCIRLSRNGERCCHVRI